jgi:long-chain acyl-CoA synthetase
MKRETYEYRPWLDLYSPHVPPDLQPSVRSSLEHLAAAVASSPRAPCVAYFGTVLDFATVDALSSALAVGLSERGVKRGDRVAVMSQNVPQFVLATLASWKLGGVVVPLNPMLKQQEVEYHLRDSGAKAVVALEDLYRQSIEPVESSTSVEEVITTSELDFLEGQEVPRPLRSMEHHRPEGTDDLLDLVRRYEGSEPEVVSPEVSDVAFLTYTSGTTGRPKGAMNTHANVAFNSEVYRTWMQLGPGDVVLGAAPLFHITGLIAHLGVALAAGIPLVLAYRFDPQVVLSAIEERRATFTVASITAFLAMLDHPDIKERDLSSFRKVYSGGAPIAPATVEAWEAAAGSYIHNAYGLTETTSPSHLVPMGRRAPVDPDTGALSVGVPVPSTIVRVVDVETGEDVEPGELGEFWTKGPQVVPGYWQRPKDTAETIVEGGFLRTGDVGKMSEDGWYFIVDRAKDMINAAGYKVWPREVEDFLYQHPAVREAAVVGVPDTYRGETVKAFVALRSGSSATPEELVEFCRSRMAAYKYPRMVEIVEEIPKTATGKFLRRELRDREQATEDGGGPTEVR